MTQWVELSPHSKKGLGLIPRLRNQGPSCVEFACSHRVLLFATVQRQAVRPTGHPKSPLGAGVNVYVCLLQETRRI